MVLGEIVSLHCKNHKKLMNILSIFLAIYGSIALFWALDAFSVS
jgi:hypothetical protein